MAERDEWRKQNLGPSYAGLTSQQAVLCAPLATVGGISVLQRGKADLQRG